MRAAWQGNAKLKPGAAQHGWAGDDVFGNRVLQKAFRGNDSYAAGSGVGGADDTADTAVMVDVAMRIDHREHRHLAQMLVGQIQGGAGYFGGGERVYHDPAGAGVDERHGGNVEAAYLVDAVRHFEQAVLGEDFGVAP